MSFSVDDIHDIDAEIREYINTIGQKINSQKGVFTVLVTLITHKTINPKQDIRFHQTGLPNGFSGRTIDTAFITPTLKELKLPSMAESGWLTRSLEQPFPYTLDYNGKISDKRVKNAFLKILDYLENNSTKAENLLRLLLFEAIKNKTTSTIVIQPLTNPELVTINVIIESLIEHFSLNYHIHGGSKLPVLAFYAIYQCLVNELSRYRNCSLAELGSHTASDKTSKSSGDIEVLRNEQIFESVEIKLDKVIDSHIVRVAIEKIHKFNPTRYYILTNAPPIEDENEQNEIYKLIETTKIEHGCQIIVNGIIPTLKYYLRLLEEPTLFIENYSSLVESDTELKPIHKQKWDEIIENNLNTKADSNVVIAEIVTIKSE